MLKQLTLVFTNILLILTISSANATTWYEHVNNAVQSTEDAWAGLNTYQKIAVGTGAVAIGLALGELAVASYTEIAVQNAVRVLAQREQYLAARVVSYGTTMNRSPTKTVTYWINA